MPEAPEAGAVVAPEAAPAAVVEAPQHQQQTDGTPPEEGGEQPAARTYTQDEVDRIVKKAKSNTRYLTRKETEADVYRRLHQQPPAEAPKAPAQQEEKEPNLADFPDWNEYQKAMARHEGRKAAREEHQAQRAQDARARETESRQQRVDQHAERVQKARAELPDFDEVVGSSEVPVTDAMVEAILESDVSAKLQYHLAKNPAEAERIARLSPTAQVKAMGVLEAKLGADASAPAPTPQAQDKTKVSSAPPPIAPVGSRSGGPRPLEKLGMDDYMAERRKQNPIWRR